MAKTAIDDYSTTASSNTDIDGLDSTGATGLVKSGDNYTRSMMAHSKAKLLDLGASNTVGGTADAITVTLASNTTALYDGMRLSINAPGTNTGAVTIAVTNSGATLLGTKKVRKWSAGSETALSAGDITQNQILNLVYDSARDTGSGAFMIDGAISAIPYTVASASGAASLQFAEDTDNGSNKITLQGAASLSGDITVTLPSTAGTLRTNAESSITLGTAVASTSGTSIDFTSIPSWVRQIVVSFDGVSTSGAANILFQIGDSGGVENTGYLGAGSVMGAATVASTLFTAGFGLGSASTAAIYQGSVTFTLVDASTNTWAAQGMFGRSDSVGIYATAGGKSLSATLDRVRVTTSNGTDTFDAGKINIAYL